MGEKRTLRPRPRPNRPLGVADDARQERLEPPTPTKDGRAWTVTSKLGQRLYEKSRLGQPDSTGLHHLSDVEVLYCHWNRHLPLPRESWLEDRLRERPLMLHEAVVFDVARSGGELVVPGHRIVEDAGSWGIRWSRHAKPPAPPVARCTWTQAASMVQWDELLGRAQASKDDGLIEEWYVIDDEFDVTMYHVAEVEFSGSLRTWERLDASERDEISRAWSQRTPCADGHRLPLIDGSWPWPQLGTTQASGRLLSAEESEVLGHLVDGTTLSDVATHALRLMNVGVLLRPGFKFGCRWRVYNDDMDAIHAPWLLQTLDRRPTTWEEVCLAVRLAEGVNKIWVTEVSEKGEGRWLSIRRALPGRHP